jgi:hypothetical protein
MKMTITVELTVKYFDAESCTSVEYVESFDSPVSTLAAAETVAKTMVENSQRDAYNSGAMMDTFYYEYDFLVDPDLAEQLAVEQRFAAG